MTPQISFSALGNTPDEIVRLAVEGEKIGFARIFFGDHLAQPVEQTSKYPYAEKALTLTTIDYIDPLVQAAGIAGATTDIGIGTAVYLLTMHHPLIVSRALTTLQTIAQGRFVFGVGAGWMPEEYDAIDVPFKRRGRRMDEALEILRIAQDGGPFEYHGTEFDFAALEISHRSVKTPLIVGGTSDAAKRRAARLGDGWYSTPNYGPEDVVQSREAIEKMRVEFGTTDREFNYYVRLAAPDPELLAAFVAEGFERFTVGATELFPRTQVASMTLDDKIEVMQRVADDLGVTARV